MDVGERWAYEIPKTYKITQVRIEKIGNKRPPRVLIAFLDDEYEGATDWVTPGRLKVLWADVDAYRQREAAWNLLRGESIEITDVESFAVDHVLLDNLSKSVATRLFNHGNYGLIGIHDWDALEELTGSTRAELQVGPAHVEDGVAYCAWPTTYRIAAAYAYHHSDQILRELDLYEKKQVHETIYGRLERRQGREHFTEPEFVAEWYEEYTAPMIEIIRGWCGDAAASRDELTELRAEQWRIVELVNRAVSFLLINGDENRAWLLHSQMYPDAVRKGWKSRHQLRIESDARWKAEREKSADLAREVMQTRRIELEARAEREKARLLDYDPPPWARE